MSWGHAALELDAEADERAVKRAYAKRLRTTRPDDDPQGFQQLHEAYQAALRWAQHRAQWDEEEEEESAEPEPAAVIDAEPVAHDPVRVIEGGGVFDAVPLAAPAQTLEPALDVERFAQRVITAAAESEPSAFQRWLELRPELWSLRDKPLIGATVLEQLLHQDVPVCAHNFDVLAHCFRWDEVGSGLDPYDASDCRMRLHRRWVVQPRNRAGLVRFLHRDDAPMTEAEVQARMDILTRPWHRLQALMDAWLPRRVVAMRETLAMLGIDQPDQTLPPLRPAQVAFWLAVARRDELNGPRLQLAVLRSAYGAAAMMVVMLLLGLITGASSGGGFVAGGFVAALGVLVGGSLWLPLRWLVGWQTQAENPSRGYRTLRLLLIPLLALTAFLVIHVADARGLGSTLAFATMVLALVRWWRRAGYQFRFNAWLLLVLWPFLKVAGLAIMLGEVAIGIALVAWTVDAVTQVARWR